MERKPFIDENGNGRGYRVDESGILSIVTVPVYDGVAIDNYGDPLDMTGEVVELIGWPDSHAVAISDNYMVALSV
jgi:hypothetical protein